MTESHTSYLEETLLLLEEQAWQALSRGTGADFYRGNLTPDAVMVFSLGVVERDAAIDARKPPRRGRRTPSTTRGRPP